MEFNEKLQELRKQKELTQEELAQALYVSRAAISKWESGRGYPSIDSLKQISTYFCVSIDTLLSGNEALSLAEETHRKKNAQHRNLVFSLLDLSASLFLFFPFFRQINGGTIEEVSLLSLTGIAPYMKSIYLIVVIGMVVSGLLGLVLQNCQHAFWMHTRTPLSFLFHIVGTLLFMLSPQPYASASLFLFLGIKTCLLIKIR